MTRSTLIELAAYLIVVGLLALLLWRGRNGNVQDEPDESLGVVPLIVLAAPIGRSIMGS